MPFPGSVSKANQSKTKKNYLSVISAAMNFYSLYSANRSEVFSGCDKRIWIEKSSFYSTKAPRISARQFSFIFDKITAILSNSKALCSEHCSELFSNSFQAVSSGKPTQCRRRELSQSGSSNHALLITKKCPRD